MVSEKYGSSLLWELVKDLYEKGLYNSDSNIDSESREADLNKKISNTKSIDKILNSFNTLAPVKKRVEGLTQFEATNSNWVLAAILGLELDKVPLHTNSPFNMVREIALWRLKINR